MGTSKRERQKAARQARLEAEAAAAQRATTRRRAVRLGIAAVVLLFVIFLVTRNDDTSSDVATDATTTTTIPEPTEFAYGTGECAPADGSADRTVTFADAPQLCIDPSARYTATVDTTEGTFEIELDPSLAPGTVNSFVNLARYHFYDGVLFHRVVNDFVIQAGDPQPEPDGTGGPGYAFADELPASLDAYTPGTVAMANSGANTNGSQFYVYFGPNPLPGPLYSIFGHVTPDTLEVARKILTVDVDANDRPTTDVVIRSVTITESGADG